MRALARHERRSSALGSNYSGNSIIKTESVRDKDGEVKSGRVCEEEAKTSKMNRESHWKRARRKEEPTTTTTTSRRNTIDKKQRRRRSSFIDSIFERQDEEVDKVCLRLISHSNNTHSQSQFRLSRASNGPAKSKMLTTIILITALATCYGLALSASTAGAGDRPGSAQSSLLVPDLIISEPGK